MKRPALSVATISPATQEGWEPYHRGCTVGVILPGQGVIVRDPETGRYHPAWVEDVIIVADRGEGFAVQYGLCPLVEYDWTRRSTFHQFSYHDSCNVTPAPFLEFVDTAPPHLKDKTEGKGTT